MTRYRIVDDQVAKFVADEAPQRLGDGLEQLAQVQARDHRIGDVEQHLQAVALAGELLLVALRAFVVEDIFDGHGHLPGNVLQELEVGALVNR